MYAGAFFNKMKSGPALGETEPEFDIAAETGFCGKTACRPEQRCGNGKVAAETILPTRIIFRHEMIEMSTPGIGEFPGEPVWIGTGIRIYASQTDHI
jgi:hypothetical protein